MSSRLVPSSHRGGTEESIQYINPLCTDGFLLCLTQISCLQTKGPWNEATTVMDLAVTPAKLAAFLSVENTLIYHTCEINPQFRYSGDLCLPGFI